MNLKHLDAPDWSKIPAPIGDEDLSHLLKYKIRSVKLKSTGSCKEEKTNQLRDITEQEYINIVLKEIVIRIYIV